MKLETETTSRPPYPNLMAACEKGAATPPSHLIARHPSIAAEIDAAWGSPACVALLDEMICPENASRRELSFAVLGELTALKALHESRFPRLHGNGAAPPVIDQGIAFDNGASKADSAKTPAAPPPDAATATGPQTEEGEPVEEKSRWPELTTLDELIGVLQRRAKGERLPNRDSRLMLDILKEHASLADTDIDRALMLQKQGGRKHEPMGKILQSLGLVDTETIVRVLCMQQGVLMVNLKRFQPPPDLLKIITLDVARKHQVLPIVSYQGTLLLAVDNPFGFEGREYFAFLTKLKVELVMASSAQITSRLGEYGQVRSVRQGNQEFQSLAKQALGGATDALGSPENEEPSEDGEVSQNDATIVGLVNKIISDAAEIGASDIHIESFPGDALARIRFRRDGRMEDYSQYSASYHRAVVSRIKIMSSLNIAERRMPQDGKISFMRPTRQRIDLRVATIPTVRGIENVTIRLLHAGDPIPLDNLHMSQRDLEVFRRLVLRPYGLLLVCGPTGSGKTTTLHSVLRELNRPESKIWTAEDPIEIVQKHVCQVQVNPHIGWTFAMALRAFLRADPDIIMIGEMRDLETAGIAIEASMTGHLVLSTLHTNSASETAARLLDIGIDPFNLSDALTGVLAQRLTRKLCKGCARKRPTPLAELEELAAEYYFSAHLRMPSKVQRGEIVDDWRARLAPGDDLALWSAKGCEQCGGEGYKGRVAVFELLEMTPQIRELVAHKSSAAALQKVAVEQGMRTLKQDGIEKALLGLTDMTQVRAACS